MSDNEPHAEEEEHPRMFSGTGGNGVNYSEYFDTEEIFETDKLAIESVQVMAISQGFEVVVSSHKKEGRVKLLKCARGERYRSKVKPGEKIRDSNSKACKCKFQLRVIMLPDGNWRIYANPDRGYHNHEMVAFPVGYRQISGLCPDSKAIVRDMSAAQAKPAAIHAAILAKNPEDNSSRRHVYNEIARIRRNAFQHRDVAAQFFHLATNSGYIHWEKADCDGVLTDIFMAHPQSLNLLRTYHWLIAMDSTYKTNRYEMPLVQIVGMTPTNKNFLIGYAIVLKESDASYQWVLERLRFMLGPLKPTVIVTDRELGLMNALKVVFPGIPHFLCTWHINQKVEERVGKILGDRKLGEMFKQGKWKKIMKAPTEAEFVVAVNIMRDAYKNFPQVSQYVESTWLVYKEKFVAAWTNNVLHLGNTTTCRVESQHSSLKGWLNTSTGALDTIWTKINKQVESQYIEIRRELEDSRRSSGTQFLHFPYQYVTCRASKYSLKKISAEIERMRGLSDEVYERCGHVMRTAFELPCACELKNVYMSKTPISPDSIHPFWKTLLINTDVRWSDLGDEVDGDVDPTDPMSGSRTANAQQYYDSWHDQVHAQDPVVIERITNFIRSTLHPEGEEYTEPYVNETRRGRPTGSSSTRRDPSSWEYSQRTRGRPPSSRSSRGRSSSRSRGRSSSSSVNNNGRGFTPLEDFHNREQIVGILHQFITGVRDVLGDGNCGFRVVADYVFGSEEFYHRVRDNLANAIGANEALYQIIYENEGVGPARQRILWRGGYCQHNHWMEVHCDLFVIANCYNAAVFFYGYGNGSTQGLGTTCVTVLPMFAPDTSTRPSQEIAIGHCGDYYRHYIRLDLKENHPVPHIGTLWHENHHPSVDGWDQLYVERMATWQTLINNAI